MFDGFLRHYSEIEVVNVERELKVGWWVFCQFNGDKNDKWSVLFSTTFRFVTRNKRNMVTLALVASTSLLINTNSLFYVDKVIFFFLPDILFFLVGSGNLLGEWSWEENMANPAKEEISKPLIFHDERLAFRPSPIATSAMFIWFPFGFIIFLIRSLLGMLLPYKLFIAILSLTGTRGIIVKQKSFTPQLNSEGKSRGTLYFCKHRTLFNPIWIKSLAIKKPLTAVTYSVSMISELFSPIKTV